MKVHIIPLATLLLMTGCTSIFGSKLGMTEKRWLISTWIAETVYIEDNVKAYKYNGDYYYFLDGILVKIYMGRLSAQAVKSGVKQEGSSLSRYEKLRELNERKKNGIIFEEEFKTEKSKILAEN